MLFKVNTEMEKDLDCKYIHNNTYKNGKEKIEVYSNNIIELTERSGYDPHFMIIYKIGIKEDS